MAVKCLKSNGGGTEADCIKGVEWAVNDMKARNLSTAVLNASIGGDKSQPLNDAMAAAVKSGLVVVVAAGAC